ncbi:MAG: hypothetical protein WC760_15005 [Bacteroidia bacterium]|jgi:hypothetical protein
MPERRWSRWLPVSLLLGDNGLWDGHRHWPSFNAWCEANPRRACRLWLASTLLRELVCDEALPLADDAAVLAWARPLLQHYHGEAALAWPLAAWQQGRRRGVSALQGVSLAVLRNAADDAGVRLLGVAPWWSLVLRRALKRHAALRRGSARLLIVEGPCVAVIGLEVGSIKQLELRRLQAAEPDALSQWLQDSAGPPPLAVGYGLAAGPVIGIDFAETLTGAAPSPRWLQGAFA